MNDGRRMHVQAAGKARVTLEGGLPAEIREGSHVGQRGVGECERRSARHRARHVRDAVVNDAVYHESGIGMRRRVAGLEAAALIDCDVDEHRALSSSS